MGILVIQMVLHIIKKYNKDFPENEANDLESLWGL